MSRIEQVLFSTMDPQHIMQGTPMPAMTTLLHKVCGNNSVKFEEACRLIELFIAKALESSDHGKEAQLPS